MIGKILLNACESSRDVEDLLSLLSNPTAVTQLREALGSLASPLSGAPKVAAGSDEVKVLRDGEDDLGALFRQAGMTNAQVERWLQGTFGVSLAVGKGRLDDYLGRVSRAIGPEEVKRIRRLLREREKAKKSAASISQGLKEVWDGTDAALHPVRR